MIQFHIVFYDTLGNVIETRQWERYGDVFSTTICRPPEGTKTYQISGEIKGKGKHK